MTLQNQRRPCPSPAAFAAAAGLIMLFLVSPMHALAKTDRVLARVNGKAIYASEVEANLPQDAFEASQDDMRTMKLERLIEVEVARQFLRAKKITVSDQVVDAEIKQNEITPPSAGCSCCRYNSLQEFLDANGSSMEEFREAVRNTKGMERYLEMQWQKAYPTPASRQNLISRRRAGIDKKYAKVFQIFFNTFQQAGYADNREDVEKSARQKATAAWKRLNNGEPFDQVAKAVSQDAMSRDAGGALGCIDRRSFGNEVRAALAGAKAGAYTRPIGSAWGFHIVKWEKMTDEDVETVLKQEYNDKKQQEIMDVIVQKAKIVRYAQKKQDDDFQ